MNIPFQFPFRACLSAAFVFLCCSFSLGADVYWIGNANSDWSNSFNWNNETGPADTDYVFILFGDVNYSAADGDSVSLRGFRQTGGTLNISGGSLEVANLASAYSSFNSEVIQTGGSASINAIEIGSEPGGAGSYVLNDGELRIARGSGGRSLYLGASRNGSAAGTGTLTLAGGSFTTRDEVRIGSAAGGTRIFEVMGTQPIEIGIGGANDDIDGTWYQHSGSSLVARFDAGGCTPIIVHDNSSPDGTSATFENGSILDVDHLVGDGGGTWTVVEVQNGDIIDNGLALADGVDTSIWSFSVDNSGPNGKLLVTAAGDPAPQFGFDLIVGSDQQQKMRYGMDYERLWFWSNADRALVSKWSAIDTRIDYIRVAMNSGY